VERLPEDRTLKKVLKNVQDTKSSVGKPRRIWKIK
jgi:hypothetical protein